MIWCIKTYIYTIHYVKPIGQLLFKKHFQKVDQHAGGKWLIHDTKGRNMEYADGRISFTCDAMLLNIMMFTMWLAHDWHGACCIKFLTKTSKQYTWKLNICGHTMTLPKLVIWQKVLYRTSCHWYPIIGICNQLYTPQHIHMVLSCLHLLWLNCSL